MGRAVMTTGKRVTILRMARWAVKPKRMERMGTMVSQVRMATAVVLSAKWLQKVYGVVTPGTKGPTAPTVWVVEAAAAATVIPEAFLVVLVGAAAAEAAGPPDVPVAVASAVVSVEVRSVYLSSIPIR